MTSGKDAMLGGLLLPMLFAIFASAPDALAQGAGVAAPPSDKARIVFVRVKQHLGTDAIADLLQIVDGKPEYVGRLEQGDRIVVDISPGKKEFMTVSYRPQKLGGPTTVGDLLFADVQAGKTYGVLLRAHGGSGGFIPEPVRADRRYRPDSPQVTEAIAGSREVRMSPEEVRRVSPDRAGEHVRKVYELMSAAYKKKGPDRLKERTLRPEDTLQ